MYTVLIHRARDVMLHCSSFYSNVLQHGAHTRTRVHLVGSLNPSWRKTGTEAALRSRGQYDSSQLSYRQISVESESPERLSLPEAVVFVCVHVIMCQLSIYGRGLIKMPCVCWCNQSG